MFLFGKRKKEAAAVQSAPGETTVVGCAVKVLGSGCTKCNELEAAVKQALTMMGRDAQVEHVTDFAQIAAYGVMQTPALVVDEQVVSYGRVLKPEEAVELLKKAWNEA